MSLATRPPVPITPERVAKLRAYGLSEYASRTYLALLDLGTAEARDISGISKVPASKIYRILEQLHEKGLVDVLPEFPRKYAPVPFSEFLDKLHDEHKVAAQAIEREREALARMFAIAGDVESSDRGGFTVIRGRRNVMEKIDEIAASASRSLFILASPGFASRGRALGDLLRAAASRGVSTRLLLPARAQIAPDALRDVGAVRRLVGDQIPAGGAAVLADGSRAVVVSFVPDDGHAYDGNDVAVATDQPGVAAILEALHEWPWREASPIEGLPAEAPLPPARVPVLGTADDGIDPPEGALDAHVPTFEARSFALPPPGASDMPRV